MTVKVNALATAALLALGLGTAGQAEENAKERDAVEEREIAEMTGYEQVDSIPALRRMHSFHALDRDSLIIWATPFQPYLVELRHPSHDLRFARAIGVTQSASRIYPRFDAVQVDGFRYPIERIYKLSRDEAKELRRES